MFSLQTPDHDSVDNTELYLDPRFNTKVSVFEQYSQPVTKIVLHDWLISHIFCLAKSIASMSRIVGLSSAEY